jgi:hypothetical protein
MKSYKELNAFFKKNMHERKDRNETFEKVPEQIMRALLQVLKIDSALCCIENTIYVLDSNDDLKEFRKNPEVNFDLVIKFELYGNVFPVKLNFYVREENGNFLITLEDEKILVPYLRILPDEPDYQDAAKMASHVLSKLVERKFGN